MIMDIFNAISTLIAQQNDLTIYIQNVGEGFERPSFFISQISAATEDLNREVLNNNIFIQIVYFAPWDKYKNPDIEDQLNTYDMLKGLFKKGYFMVGDRAVKINQLTGGPRDNDIYLTLDLSLTENKQPDEPQIPVMENINFSLKEG